MTADLTDTVLVCVSLDLPFAQARFCVGDNLEHVVTASAFRHREFGEAFGVTLEDGPLRGLLARAVVVLDENGTVWKDAHLEHQEWFQPWIEYYPETEEEQEALVESRPRATRRSMSCPPRPVDRTMRSTNANGRRPPMVVVGI